MRREKAAENNRRPDALYIETEPHDRRPVVLKYRQNATECLSYTREKDGKSREGLLQVYSHEYIYIYMRARQNARNKRRREDKGE